MHNLDVCNWAKVRIRSKPTAWAVTKSVACSIPETQIFDHHFVEFTYPDGHEDVQPVPARPGLLQTRLTNMRSARRGTPACGPNGDEKDANGVEFKFPQSLRAGALRPGRGHSQQLALQRRALRRHQQLYRRAGRHGDL